MSLEELFEGLSLRLGEPYRLPDGLGLPSSSSRRLESLRSYTERERSFSGYLARLWCSSEPSPVRRYFDDDADDDGAVSTK